MGQPWTSLSTNRTTRKKNSNCGWTTWTCSMWPLPVRSAISWCGVRRTTRIRFRNCWLVLSSTRLYKEKTEYTNGEKFVQRKWRIKSRNHPTNWTSNRKVSLSKWNAWISLSSSSNPIARRISLRVKKTWVASTSVKVKWCIVSSPWFKLRKMCLVPLHDYVWKASSNRMLMKDRFSNWWIGHWITRRWKNGSRENGVYTTSVLSFIGKMENYRQEDRTVWWWRTEKWLS